MTTGAFSEEFHWKIADDRSDQKFDHRGRSDHVCYRSLNRLISTRTAVGWRYDPLLRIGRLG
jgi:hypothetical protein